MRANDVRLVAVSCSAQTWGIICTTQYKGKLNIHLNLTSGGRAGTPIPAFFEHGQGRDLTDQWANETLVDWLISVSLIAKPSDRFFFLVGNRLALARTQLSAVCQWAIGTRETQYAVDESYMYNHIFCF